MVVVNLMTSKVAAKLELLFSKPASNIAGADHSKHSFYG
jgi:hypothetical protein